MESRPFGTTGGDVAAIGQGSWQIDAAREPDAIAALQRGIDLGLTHIDTAEMYGSGASERVIGKAIRGRRDRVFLVSKVLPTNASAQGTIVACERTLANLGVDALDCYLLHWRGRYPLADTIGAFLELQRAGKIRSWGVSNFDVADLEEAHAIAGPPACNQVLYHVQERAIEHAVIPWCERHGTAIVAYTPFGQSSVPYDPKTRGGKVLADIAARHGATAHQVVLRFLLRNPSVLVIPKASKIAHVEDNAAAGKLRLGGEEIAAIEAAFRRGPAPRDLPMI
jgi:diketogulonate reductase-like aldo/keto reductase